MYNTAIGGNRRVVRCTVEGQCPGHVGQLGFYAVPPTLHLLFCSAVKCSVIYCRLVYSSEVKCSAVYCYALSSSALYCRSESCFSDWKHRDRVQTQTPLQLHLSKTGLKSYPNIYLSRGNYSEAPLFHCFTEQLNCTFHKWDFPPSDPLFHFFAGQLAIPAAGEALLSATSECLDSK